MTKIKIEIPSPKEECPLEEGVKRVKLRLGEALDTVSAVYGEAVGFDEDLIDGLYDGSWFPIITLHCGGPAIRCVAIDLPHA